jgi:hypothetical protein
MVETIPLSQRRVDIVLVAFFLINLLFVSYFIDTEQLVIANPAHFTYPIWPPRPVIDAVHWWGNNFDPLLIARPVFFKVTIWLDNLLYGPFYLIATYAYIKDDWTPVKIGWQLISTRASASSRSLWGLSTTLPKKRFSSSRWT